MSLQGKSDWVQDLRINPDRLKTDIYTLSQIGRSEQGTLTRHSFSPEYEEARAWLNNQLSTSTITFRDDEVGNTFERIGPADTIFVHSIGGRNHRRDEWTDWHDLENGANVLLQTMLRLIYQ